MPNPNQRIALRVYRNIFRFCKAIDVNAVNSQHKLKAELEKLTSSETVMPVYQRLCDFISRKDIKPLLENNSCSKAACKQLFRLPDSEHDKTFFAQGSDRVDMGFAALRFLGDRFGHVVEQQRDVVKAKEWIEILKDKQDQVEHGAIAITRTADPSVQASSVLAQLDDMAAQVQKHLTSISDLDVAKYLMLEHPVPKECHAGDCLEEALSTLAKEIGLEARQLRIMAALNKVMFKEMKFEANLEEYYDPRNGLIHEALQRKTGNAITLSIIYIAVARRCGLYLSGSECPGHFVVRGETQTGSPFFLDVFKRGKLMSHLQCVKEFIKTDTSMREKNRLEAVTPLRLYARMMRNLVNSHMIIGHGGKALLWSERLNVMNSASEKMLHRKVRLLISVWLFLMSIFHSGNSKIVSSNLVNFV
ncbi:hypothetical protein GUITHDRAFT_112449 [Guillardia theta CCMP2712]|uniref:Protein SirB1 N-terminal domain-containing protein n=2 Tax=Guillardia theta TaxID=55529 RepID=L1IYX7_GUITC|nr:hypothetical protein GUITHDRAFT_112449 [Guillardia theta CCMP2712]EKX41478.1 hypothetical protein GUITHDRAFT_112449 [Guillardia theta CCMP2712]|eukprot:XP_005828458.1 hypothetical protein GUITHDRAFT_112449 [Guillardia theta CCMP2712]